MASNRIALKSLANLSKSTIRHTLNFSNGKTRHFSAPKMPLSQGQVSYLRIGVTECCFWDQNLQACQQQLLSLIHFAGCFWIFFGEDLPGHVFCYECHDCDPSIIRDGLQQKPPWKPSGQLATAWAQLLELLGLNDAHRLGLSHDFFACSQLLLGTATWRSDQGRLKSYSDVWGLKETKLLL